MLFLFSFSSEALCSPIWSKELVQIAPQHHNGAHIPSDSLDPNLGSSFSGLIYHFLSHVSSHIASLKTYSFSKNRQKILKMIYKTAPCLVLRDEHSQVAIKEKVR